MLRAPLFGLLIAAAGSAWCSVADPAAEQRAMAIAAELRCLVCQNQTIADSHAPLAIDLKNQIREQVAQGKGDNEIRGYMVERYGEFVLYRPAVRSATLFLWFGPFLVLAAGLVALFMRIRRQRGAEPQLTEDERRAAQQLLGEKSPS
jgi:cytochrome c-type biogenesis protein CcmH